jgi:hypothetical protein
MLPHLPHRILVRLLSTGLTYHIKCHPDPTVEIVQNSSAILGTKGFSDIYVLEVNSPVMDIRICLALHDPYLRAGLQMKCWVSHFSLSHILTQLLERGRPQVLTTAVSLHKRNCETYKRKYQHMQIVQTKFVKLQNHDLCEFPKSSVQTLQ